MSDSNSADKQETDSLDSVEYRDLQRALSLSQEEVQKQNSTIENTALSTLPPGSYAAPVPNHPRTPSVICNDDQERSKPNHPQQISRLQQKVDEDNSIPTNLEKLIEDNYIANYLSFFARHISSVSAAYNSTEPYKSYSRKPQLGDYAYKTDAQLVKERALAARKKKEDAQKEEADEEAESSEAVTEIPHDTKLGHDHEGVWSSADVYNQDALIDVEQESEHDIKQNQSDDMSKEEIDDTSHEQHRIDYLAYGLAYFLYKVEQYLPVELDQNPHQQFRYAKLVSNVERLYVNLSTNSVMDGMKQFGNIIMWKNRPLTFLVVTIYLTLVFTDMLLNTIIAGVLIGITSRKVFPPSSSSQIESSKDEQERAREIVDLEAEFGLDVDGNNAPGQREKSMKEAYKAITESHGREIQLVTGDLADFIEKLKNLYLWRKPKATRNFILRAVLPALIGLQFISHAALVRGSLAGLGFVIFIWIPITINYPRYRRMAWNMPEVPTDAQYALSVMRQRVRKNEPLPVLADPLKKETRKKTDAPRNPNNDNTDSTEIIKSPKKGGSKWSRMAASLQRGGKAAERGTDMISQVINGDKGVFIRQAQEVWASRNDEDSERTSEMLSQESDNGSIKSKRHIGLEPSRVAYLPLRSTHFAILKSSPGTLALNSSELRFKPFKGPDVVVQLDALVAVRKNTSLRVGVEVSSGLELSWEEEEDVKVMRLTNVARRDDAFNQLVACSRNVWVDS
ncbi:hypothetical protein E3Q02_03980 [Wallemia mellicola]|uniref:Uncharacterized protein n=1 Tax=Wallemia mellicola TaxID=1708541 RepID=A0AB38MVD9_9BASI|nr:hypothetical protein E3Q02_03980 [Wallemia mellicola]